MNRRTWITVGGGGLVLAVSIVLQLVVTRYFANEEKSEKAANSLLRQALAGEISDWPGEDLPLGRTADEQVVVLRQLNYDDYLFRQYTRGAAQVGVFICYWGPDKMPVNLVASHTPDRCWSSSGWVCDGYDLWTGRTAGGLALQPAYWRKFSMPGGSSQHVLYWHLVGGRAQLYGGNSLNLVVNWRYWWLQALRYGLRGSEPQYFVRVTSNRPFEELWNESGFQEILRRLGHLGLQVPAA